MLNGTKTKTQRAKLEPRREPYWSRLEDGFFLGYRAAAEGEGTWIARLRDGGKQRYAALGTFAEYDDAAKAARAWRELVDAGVTITDATVETACKAYVEHLRMTKGAAAADDADGRLKRLVYKSTLASIPLAKLKTTHIRDWLKGQLATADDDDEDDLRRSKDSANRNLNTLKAALNRALKDRLVATDAGWKTVERFAQVGRRRERLLTQTERAKLLDHCTDDIAPFVRGLLLTAARPGELAKTTASDFDKRAGTLTLDGKTGRRTITLSTAAIKFLTAQVSNKLPSAPIFATSYGSPWNRDTWKKPFRAAVRAAGLPDEIVMYHLRHAAISELLLAGVQSSLVAMLAGTSTAMIDAHYGHLLHNKTRKMLDAVRMV